MSSDREERLEELQPGEVRELEAYPHDALLVPIAVHQGGELVWAPGMSKEERARRLLAAISRRCDTEGWPSWWDAERIEEAKKAITWVDAHPLPRLEEEPDDDRGRVGRITSRQATPEELAAARRTCGWKEGEK